MALNRLISCRKNLGWTQAKIAKKANISRAYYANIELGRKIPSMAIAKRIAEVLHSTVDYIFFW
ncbi:XRE family transcriptional regulator (plasmid) [Brevibacillus laterosporus]|uniref:XRE family transcriptional regulator n=1 Tax=Brevibacillus laterosporus TaxID=1465 RepID=A0A518V226_BRELA|nr:XRE family transcriptional regulator [Brevibacillus laterosporus]